MYVQGVENVYDLNFNGREGAEKVTYGEVFLQAEQEYSRHNFEHADIDMLKRHFADAETGVPPAARGRTDGNRHLMAQPAYDQAIKASHRFNLLDARGRHLRDGAAELHPAGCASSPRRAARPGSATEAAAA